jgi:hypothetical protein
MSPELIVDNQENLDDNIFIFSKPGEYYLVYTAETDQEIQINLTGNSNFKLEVLDIWNMHVVEEKTVGPGNFQYKTSFPYTALNFNSINE